MKVFAKNIVSKRKALFLGTFIILVLGAIYFNIFGTLTINPLTEKQQQQALELTKQETELSTFSTDGCSAGMSKIWKDAVMDLSQTFEEFDNRYTEASSVPFEAACVTHDRAYHTGIGGYAGRLMADNQLRTDILLYAANNTEEIRKRTNLSNDEQALFLYEGIAEATYRGVRVGGAPCTGEAYAWGFGYGGGNCME